MLPLEAGPVVLRRWRETDTEAVVREADSRAVWRNLTHVFPHPYTGDAAREWIAHCQGQEPASDLAITLDDQVIGSCGISVGKGVGAYTGDVGYWVGERHWGKGMASAALAAFLQYVWATFEVERLQAEVFAWNPASAHVLERNGFVLEGTRRLAIHKDGEIIDEWFYALLRSESGSA